MAPRQNTFTVVPNPMGLQGLMARPTSGPDSRPPMTSKQAQKAYRERTRGPRLSKAEQRQIELAEQERIRRELDKEKSLNRARTLRERKKAKEQQALNEKKRKGLPLVNVRPSQDTIARFVRRGNGSGNKRDSASAKVDLPVIEEEAEGGQSITGDGVGKESNSAGAGVDLPVIEEETGDDRSNAGSEPDKKISRNEAAGTRGYKRRRLDHDSIEDNDNLGKPSGVEPGETVPTLKASQLKVIDTESLPKDAEASATAVQFPWEKNLATKAEEQAGGSPRSPQADATPMMAVGTARNEEHDDAAHRKGHGKTGAEGTSNYEDNMRSTAKMSQNKISTNSASAGPPSTQHPLRLPESMVQAGSTKAVEETPSGEAPATNIPPSQQRTLAQGIPGHEKATLKTENLQLKGQTSSPIPKETPVNKIPTIQARPAKKYPVPPPQAQWPNPKQAPDQHPSTRRVLQETINASNRIRPGSGPGGASRFVSPFKPALATSQRQAPRTVPAFKQHRPETLTSKVSKPQFLLPPHIRNAAAHQRPSRLASAGKQGKRNPGDDVILASPPTSTQLFVMSHIDDLFPSPSQEAREVQGTLPAATNEKLMQVPVRPPIAGFAAKTAPRPKQVTRQVTPANAPIAPPPQPAPVKPAPAKPVELFDFPFISTQDLLFSSQDLRDLEGSTPSKTKIVGGSKPAPFKVLSTVPQRPSPLSLSPGAPIQHTTPQSRTKHPTFAAEQRAVFSYVAKPPQEPKKEHYVSKQGSAAIRLHTSNNNRPVSPLCSDTLARKDKPASDIPPRPPSREKPRFFGSNGLGEELLAIDRSRKTFEEEEKRRLAESRALQNPIGNNSPGVKQAQVKQNSHETTPRPVHEGKQDLPAGVDRVSCQTLNNNTKAMSQSKIAAGGESETAILMASQETDYGDVELDSIDFDELGLDSLLA